MTEPEYWGRSGKLPAQLTGHAWQRSVWYRYKTGARRTQNCGRRRDGCTVIITFSGFHTVWLLEANHELAQLYWRGD